jgi:hypothetical protein
MFSTVAWGGKSFDGKAQTNQYHQLHDAMTAATTLALYGDCVSVHVVECRNYNVIAQFHAQEMRHASQRQRQTRELQVSA